MNSSGGNKENPPPPPQTSLQSQHQLEEQTKQKSEQAESEDDVEIAGSLLVEYLWGGKGEAKRPGEGDSRGNVGGNSEVGTVACGGSAATMTTTTKTPTQGDSDSGEGSGVQEGSGDDAAMMIDSMTSSDDSSATAAASGDDVDDEASVADEDGGGGADPEEAGVLLMPAVSRTLRRGYLAQSLARIVGAAGIIRKARRGVERRSGGDGKRENRRGGNDPGLHEAGEALALAKAGGTGEGDSGGGGGGDEASKPKGGTWGAAQEQSSAAMEALDALDKGIEELFDEVCFLRNVQQSVFTNCN